MIDDIQVFFIVITVAIVTVFLRALPFFAIHSLSNNQYLSYVGKKMPVGVMVLLVAYTFLDIDFTSMPYGLPQLGSMLIALALYWRLNNSLIAISIALAFHLFIVNNF